MNEELEFVLQTRHTGPVTAICFGPDGRWIASGSEDASIKIWEAASGRVMRTLAGHSAAVKSVVFGPDNRVLVSASADENVKLWEIDSGRVIHTTAGESEFRPGFGYHIADLPDVSAKKRFVRPSMEEDVKIHFPKDRYGVASGVDPRVRQCFALSGAVSCQFRV